MHNRIKNFHNVKEILSETVKHSRNVKKRDHLKQFAGFDVAMTSHRYDLFRKSIKCCVCGKEGQYLGLDSDIGSTSKGRAHFNLYGMFDGEEVLFTKDHIFPKSRGGYDCAENFQTMCAHCNEEKQSNIDESLFDYKEDSDGKTYVYYNGNIVGRVKTNNKKDE